jgi:DinB superfamily
VANLVQHLIVNLTLEYPAQKKSISVLADDLERSGYTVGQRIGLGKTDQASTEKALHIIGIERWGQQRLRVALGEAFKLDGHHGYKPSKDLSMTELQKTFQETRTRTIALARELERVNVGRTERVLHNNLGPLTVRGWLRYLGLHANLESRRLRPANRP